jgi:hypothetical protein
MKSKILIGTMVAAGLVASVCVSCIVWDLIRDAETADEANFRLASPLINVGEIEAVFGRPPDRKATLANGHVELSWFGRKRGSDTEALFVCDERGKVVHRMWMGPAREKPFNPLEALGIQQVRE